MQEKMVQAKLTGQAYSTFARVKAFIARRYPEKGWPSNSEVLEWLLQALPIHELEADQTARERLN
jgi:hypothetical protein